MEIIEIDNIKQYLKDGILKGIFKPFYVQNVAKITARQGKVGEIINSFTLEGNYSTTKTVFRTTNGEIDWVITNSNGDSSVLDDETFKNNFKETEVLNEYVPVEKEKLVVQVNELVQFRNKRGNSYRVYPGHYIIADEKDDFYELTPKALESHYKVIKKPYSMETDNIFFNETN